jgi:hypothetical protein
MMILTQALLVVLMGIYLVRATWFLFTGVFSPLTPVAALVLVICLVAFNRPPVPGSAWHVAFLAVCVLGAAANASLLFSTAPAYANPTNQAFSWVSLLCFACLAATLLWRQFGHAT